MSEVRLSIGNLGADPPTGSMDTCFIITGKPKCWNGRALCWTAKTEWIKNATLNSRRFCVG